MNTSCGELIASVQKDGWSYVLNPVLPPGFPPGSNMRWQFPFSGLGPHFQGSGGPPTQLIKPASDRNISEHKPVSMLTELIGGSSCDRTANLGSLILF